MSSSLPVGGSSSSVSSGVTNDKTAGSAVSSHGSIPVTTGLITPSSGGQQPTQSVGGSKNGQPSIIPVSTSSPLAISTPVQDSIKDPSCDAYGVCYDVSLRCTDQRIIINVKTSRPFHGRVYALGRSETCNAHIRNAQQFQLDMSLVGQDCNTQSVVSCVALTSCNLACRALSLDIISISRKHFDSISL